MPFLLNAGNLKAPLTKGYSEVEQKKAGNGKVSENWSFPFFSIRVFLECKIAFPCQKFSSKAALPGSEMLH